jgi:hypothetical protein
MSRASKQLGTNVTKKLLVEIQGLIAFACYDSPAVVQGGDSMTDTAQAEILAALYFGGDDPEIISYLDQFINGLHRFTGLFTSSEPDKLGQIVLTMPQKLHRHGGLNIFVGPTSITKELLSKKNFANNEKITGRTLHKKAKEVIATCKKMMSLVTASGCPYRDGTFPSGTNWDDYILWCLVAMQHESAREANKEKLASKSAPATTETAAAALLAPTQADKNEGDGVVEEEAPAYIHTALGSSRTTTFPSGVFFKAGVGFLAWALWGHIPIHDGEKMISHLFSEVKANTSFGRGTSTRSAMRKALVAGSAAPVDNRRGKKRSMDTMQEPVADDNVNKDIALLTKTLEHLSAESMEKEEKQHHHLQVRLVRDKLAARRRRSEVLLQKLTLSSKYKKRPDTELFEKMESNEEEIEMLENEIENLQQLECQRHREMIEKRRTMSIVETMIGMNPIGVSESFESSGNDSGGGGNDEDGSTDPTTNNAPAVVHLTVGKKKKKKNETIPASNNVIHTSLPVVENICMECNLIPTEHVCMRCKQVRVCACCCDGNRGLRNNTWCKRCFENETPEVQEIIRNGDYNYKY